jgi:error-prone DNA polymerase
MTAVVITYRPRSAVRDVGKALGLSLDRVDNLAKRIEHFGTEPEMADRCREAGIDPDSMVGGNWSNWSINWSAFRGIFPSTRAAW